MEEDLEDDNEGYRAYLGEEDVMDMGFHSDDGLDVVDHRETRMNEILKGDLNHIDLNDVHDVGLCSGLSWVQFFRLIFLRLIDMNLCLILKMSVYALCFRLSHDMTLIA